MSSNLKPTKTISILVIYYYYQILENLYYICLKFDDLVLEII